MCLRFLIDLLQLVCEGGVFTGEGAEEVQSSVTSPSASS